MHETCMQAGNGINNFLGVALVVKSSIMILKAIEGFLSASQYSQANRKI